MYHPCKYCDKADIERKTFEKCEKPYKQYKCWYECENKLIDILVGGLEHNIPFKTRNKQRTTEHRKENQNKWKRNKN